MAGPDVAALGFERDLRGADIVAVETADLVILDFADIDGARAKAGDADDGIRRRATGHLHRRSHRVVNRQRPGFVDQRHAAFGHSLALEKLIVGLHQNIENRIADSENVVFCVSH